MVLLLYAVVPTGDPTGTAEGVFADPPLRRLDGASVGVLYEERDRAPDRADLLPFGDAVQALTSSGPVLPVRFGTVVAGIPELTGLLREREGQWRERLEAVRGHVEMVVHARVEGAPAAPVDGSGTAYLMSRAAALHEEEERLSTLMDAIRPVASEVRVLRGNREVRLACLVSAARVASLRAAVRRWGEACEGRLAEATGPWPAFSFTETEEAR